MRTYSFINRIVLSEFTYMFLFFLLKELNKKIRRQDKDE